MIDKTTFEKIIKKQLSSVIFVQDYLQLDFDGNKITSYKWPFISANGVTRSFSEPGYRDLLCAQIAKNVADIIVGEHEFKIAFSSGDSINIQLEETDGEILFYSGLDGTMVSM